jgi:predicted transcriptional regulator
MRTVVGIRPVKRARQASSHTEEPMPTVWFDSWRQLAGLLSDENRALLRLMQERQPRTVLSAKDTLKYSRTGRL